MKLNIIIFIVLIVAFSATAYADHPDISVTVDGTTYHCSGDSGGDCSSKVAALRSLLSTCTSDTNTGWCVRNIWPNWKSNNSSCVTEGSSVCLEICSEDTNTGWCLNNCS